MLRRDFIKAGVLVGGGVILLHTIPFAHNFTPDQAQQVKERHRYRFHGHVRSGCATPPELAPYLEEGCSVHPLM